jgi:hypothetical protein
LLHKGKHSALSWLKLARNLFEDSLDIKHASHNNFTSNKFGRSKIVRKPLPRKNLRNFDACLDIDLDPPDLGVCGDGCSAVKYQAQIGGGVIW